MGEIVNLRGSGMVDSSAAVDACEGDLVAGLTLCMIVETHQPKADVYLDEGRPWIAKSRAWWCRHTFSNPGRHRRVMALLRRLGLIETRDGSVDGKRTTHVRVTDKGIAACPELPG